MRPIAAASCSVDGGSFGEACHATRFSGMRSETSSAIPAAGLAPALRGWLVTIAGVPTALNEPSRIGADDHAIPIHGDAHGRPAVRDAADKGYYVVCAEDACATHSADRHARALEAFGGYCRVQTVDEVIASFANSS